MDGFDDWVAQRDRRDDQIYAERYVGPEMTGLESLDEYGTWRTVETYGTVWVPRAVPVGWAPYRYGRWSWIAPWGWTWIDDAPWGFAPFHYGRWVVAGGSWYWVPGAYVRRPVYAPALVAWYGRPGVSVSITSGSHIGWFPLGPGEVYVPGYNVSRRYVNAINVQHVTNINHIAVVNPPPRYINQIHQDAVTYAPPRALPGRMRIQEVATRAPAQEVTRVSVQPRPPIEIDERFSKRRLVSANAAATVTPSAPAFTPGQAAPQTPARPLPNDNGRRNGDVPGRAAVIPPERATAPSQERGAPPFVARPPVVQEAPSARPEVTVPPPKRAFATPGNEGPSRQMMPGAGAPPPAGRNDPPRAEPPRAQPQPHGPRMEIPRPEAPRVVEPPRAQPQPPRPEPQAAPMPQQLPSAASQRAQAAPPVVRPAPKVQGDDGRGRGPDQEPRGKGGDGPQRAAARDR
jgi:hypothetical protein